MDRRSRPPAARNRPAGPRAHSVAPAPASSLTRRCRTRSLPEQPFARTRSTSRRCQPTSMTRSPAAGLARSIRMSRSAAAGCLAQPAGPPSAARPARSVGDLVGVLFVACGCIHLVGLSISVSAAHRSCVSAQTTSRVRSSRSLQRYSRASSAPLRCGRRVRAPSDQACAAMGERRKPLPAKRSRP